MTSEGVGEGPPAGRPANLRNRSLSPPDSFSTGDDEQLAALPAVGRLDRSPVVSDAKRHHVLMSETLERRRDRWEAAAARLLTALRIPAGETTDSRTQHRGGPRGVYGIAGGGP